MKQVMDVCFIPSVGLSCEDCWGDLLQVFAIKGTSHSFPFLILKASRSLVQTENWTIFDERRKEKYGRQLDFSVLGPSDGFDEGADAHQWQHF
jgi:hypothetical protein